MPCLSLVSLHGIAHSFTELLKPLRNDKAAIHEGDIYDLVTLQSVHSLTGLESLGFLYIVCLKWSEDLFNKGYSAIPSPPAEAGWMDIWFQSREMVELPPVYSSIQ